ncbi:MAG: FTR1 family iron permease [Eubacterium sp.]|nr:FTR1 family iron permease [Eubacterium sp.]
MKNNKKFAKSLYSILLMAFMATGLLFNSNQALAYTQYYNSFDEYVEGEKSKDPDFKATWTGVAAAMHDLFTYAKEVYAEGKAEEAYDTVNAGYYNYYETSGFERIAMGKIAGSRKTEVELQFAATKAVTKEGGSVEDFNKEVDTLDQMITRDGYILDGKDPDNPEGESEGSGSAGWVTFMACFSIILREGFEAILIVGAIMAYLAKSAGDDMEEKKRKLRPVYIGSLVGIGASFLLAWVLDLVKLANTASQEVIEGVTALLAVVVLYYVSNWMLSKSETDTWNLYIKDKVQKSNQGGSLFALAFTAFLAVFREGAEVVLFFQPMLTGDEDAKMVWAGFGLGCVILVFVYLAIKFLSLRIPIKPFFTATSILMFIMSISFLGAGIKELIEGDVFVAHTIPFLEDVIPTNDVLDVLGIYPLYETLVPQVILLLVTLIIFIVVTGRNKRIHLEAQKNREESSENQTR